MVMDITPRIHISCTQCAPATPSAFESACSSRCASARSLALMSGRAAGSVLASERAARFKSAEVPDDGVFMRRACGAIVARARRGHHTHERQVSLSSTDISRTRCHGSRRASPRANRMVPMQGCSNRSTSAVMPSVRSSANPLTLERGKASRRRMAAASIVRPRLTTSSISMNCATDPRPSAQTTPSDSN